MVDCTSISRAHLACPSQSPMAHAAFALQELLVLYLDYLEPGLSEEGTWQYVRIWGTIVDIPCLPIAIYQNGHLKFGFRGFLMSCVVTLSTPRVLRCHRHRLHRDLVGRRRRTYESCISDSPISTACDANRYRVMCHRKRSG